MRITAEQAREYHCTRYQELPNLPLYMDQVLIVLTEALFPFIQDEENMLTHTMVNNYVKQKLIDAPQKKKYGRAHIARLAMVGALKQVLSMAEIAGVLAAMEAEFGPENAYDCFAAQLESALCRAFAGESGEAAKKAPPVLEAALMALMGKLLVQNMLSEKAEPAQVKAKRKSKKEKGAHGAAESEEGMEASPAEG